MAPKSEETKRTCESIQMGSSILESITIPVVNRLIDTSEWIGKVVKVYIF